MNNHLDHEIQQLTNEDGSPVTPIEAHQMQATLNSLGSDQEMTPSPDFQQRLRQQWQDGQAKLHSAPRHAFGWFIGRGFAAAALVILGMALGLWLAHSDGPGSIGGSIAWADVVTAMNRVEQFRVTFNRPEDGKISGVDFFYRRPGVWRIHAMGRIHFLDAKEEWIFDSANLDQPRELIPGNQIKGRHLKTDMARKIDPDRMMESILAIVFDGGVPNGQPVPSLESQNGELEVFDYAADASKYWARIWVLKSSRLPIRMDMITPSQNQQATILFDYTDPQPDEFFDRQHFMQVLKKNYPGIDDPQRLYGIGRRRIGEKPRNSSQLYDPKQGIRMPIFQSITSSDTGDLLITSQPPGNRKPNGDALNQGYHEEAFDNWGNLYVRYAEDIRMEDAPSRQWYAPILPMKTGTGDHKLTLRYVIWDTTNNGGFGYDRVVGKQEVNIPAPSVQGIPGDLPGAEWINKRPQKYRGGQLSYYHLMPFTRLRLLEEAIKTCPGDLGLLVQKLYTLRDLQDEAAARTLEKQIVDVALAKPFASFEADDVLYRYAQRVVLEGQMEEFGRIEQTLRAAADQIRQANDRNNIRNMELSNSRIIPDAKPALESLKNSPQKPTVLKVESSRDGWVCLLLQLPKREISGPFGGNIWLENPNAGKDWQTGGSLTKGELCQMWVKGTGDAFTLTINPIVVVHAQRAGQFRMPYPIQVSVPAPKYETRSLLREATRNWLPADTVQPKVSESDIELSRLYDQAFPLYQDGQYSKAAEVYRKLSSLQLQRWQQLPPGNAKDFELTFYFSRQESVIDCLLKQGLLEQAAKAIESLDTELGKYPLDESRRQELAWSIGNCRGNMMKSLIQSGQSEQAIALLKTEMAKSVQSWQAWVVREFIKAGQVETARQFITQALSARPDFRTLDNLQQIKSTGNGGISSYRARQDIANKWKLWEIVNYELEKKTPIKTAKE